LCPRRPSRIWPSATGCADRPTSASPWLAPSAKPVIQRNLAARDVDEIVDYYLETGSEAIALGFLDALESAYARPESRYAYELDPPGLRSRPFKGYPYLIGYLSVEPGPFSFVGGRPRSLTDKDLEVANRFEQAGEAGRGPTEVAPVLQAPAQAQGRQEVVGGPETALGGVALISVRASFRR
jgi:toxin ParE1/3/4